MRQFHAINMAKLEGTAGILAPAKENQLDYLVALGASMRVAGQTQEGDISNLLWLDGLQSQLLRSLCFTQNYTIIRNFLDQPTIANPISFSNINTLLIFSLLNLNNCQPNPRLVGNGLEPEFL